MSLDARFESSLPADDPASLKKLRQAARKGDLQAQFQLGVLYLWGTEHVLQDFGQFAYWFRRAAKRGHADAQVFLARGYWYGGVGPIGSLPRDPVESLRWWYVAQNHNSRWDVLIWGYEDQVTEQQRLEALRRAERTSRRRLRRYRVDEIYAAQERQYLESESQGE